MEFESWEPVYEAILADFGYDRTADRRARDVLGALLADRETFAPGGLDVAGRTVAVAGAGPSLETRLDVARSADRVFAASTAADRLRDSGVRVDCLVTDLDKNPATVRAFTDASIPVVVHAHGDNVSLLREVVPGLDPLAVVPTTQAAPTRTVANFGGFTDGDRAAFLADHLGAGRLRFVGWDFDDPSLDPEKRRKLEWAESLLYWLERRRGERFAPLDGRRGGIDTSALPVGQPTD